MITVTDIEQARDRIAQHVKRTPLERSETLSRHLGTNVYVKYELFQKTGSFKPRGAFNKMLSLTEAEKHNGVVAVSGGNHAQGVAYAAGILGIDAVILMPETTAKNSLEASREYGATGISGVVLASNSLVGSTACNCRQQQRHRTLERQPCREQLNLGID